MPRRPLPLLAVLPAIAAVLAAPRPCAGQPSTIPPANPDGVSLAVARQAGLEGRVLWLDGTANLQRLSTREGVAAVFDRCVQAKVNTVVVDLKPLSGHVLYPSKVAPRLTEWRGFAYPAGYDLARTALDEGRKRGLRVYAAINVFSDGHKLFRSGPIYEKPDQQSVIYEIERSVVSPAGMRRRIVASNRAPAEGELVAYDPSYREVRTFVPGEAFVLVVKDRVTAVGAGPEHSRNGLRIPADGVLLIGRGDAAQFLQTGFKVGDPVVWSAQDRFLPIVDAPSEAIAAFQNPANPVCREYQLKIVEELVTLYDFDGIVFDRMRYASLQSDFSELSRQKFEEYLGQRLTRFPADIYSFNPNPGGPLLWGPYFKQWLEWRARNIRTWLEQASRIVRTRRPGSRVAVYVGSWYPTYYTVGVNWGSEEYQPGLEWMSAGYNTTGYAGLVDWITTGCYHPIATRAQARAAGLDETYTVQAAAETSVRAVGDVAWVYAGIYVLDYRGSPEAFREAIQAARDYSHGVMLFDLSHLEEYGWWRLLDDEFRQPRTAPHESPELLTAVRELRKALSAAGRPSLP